MAKRSRAGFTVTELMVSSAIGLFTIAVAVQVTAGHSTVLGRVADRIDTVQSGRSVADLITEDIRHAGLGIGYQPNGEFGGLMRGTFSVIGGAQFNTDGIVQNLNTGAVITDDLGVRLATGDLRTIASYSGAQGQICSGSRIAVDDTVVMLTREALHARTVRILSLNSAACSDGLCRDGCTTFTYALDTSYESDSLAQTINYVGGSMVGDYAEIVWFVAPDVDGNGELRRVEITGGTSCAARDTACGGLVAPDVETLQVAVWQWDDTLGQWVDETATGAIGDRRRLRVDVELIIKGGTDIVGGSHQPIELELARGNCVGGPCGGEADEHRRFVVRTSVEIRNGGRMLIR